MTWKQAYARAQDRMFIIRAIPRGYARKISAVGFAETWHNEFAQGYAAAAVEVPIKMLSPPRKPEEQLAFWIGYLACFEPDDSNLSTPKPREERDNGA